MFGYDRCEQGCRDCCSSQRHSEPERTAWVGLESCFRRCISGSCDVGEESEDTSLEDPRTRCRGHPAPPACSGSRCASMSECDGGQDWQFGLERSGSRWDGGGRAAEKVGACAGGWGGGGFRLCTCRGPVPEVASGIVRLEGWEVGVGVPQSGTRL